MDSNETPKRAISVPVEKALKNFCNFLTIAREDMVSVPMAQTRSVTHPDHDQKARLREKRLKMLEQLKTIGGVLSKHMELEIPENFREQELVELVRSAEDDLTLDYAAAQSRWVDLLLDKVSDTLDSTHYVNLEKLTKLMECNYAAGCAMEGNDVLLLLGSPGCGKTTALHYFAGTTFREISMGSITVFKPTDVSHPDLADMRISCGGGKEVITRHLQTVTVEVDGKTVVLCDTPSFGDHETVEEVIANSLGLVRELQKAKTVRPVLVLSREEVGFRDQFNAYPQILSILTRLLGTDSNVDLDPFNFIFTKYDTENANGLQKQFEMFVKNDDAEGSAKVAKSDANKQALIKHLIKRCSPEASIIIPTKGDPEDLLRRLMDSTFLVSRPETFFVPNLSDSILLTLKKQLKFTLLDLRDALSKNDNTSGIHRMQQMSKLANLLPEAGIYARHGFKAFKEIINQMVEDDVMEDEDEGEEEAEDDDSGSSSSDDSDDRFYTAGSGSKGSWPSSDSEPWSNVSSKKLKEKSDDMALSRHLTTVPEEAEDGDGDVKEAKLEKFCQSPVLIRVHHMATVEQKQPLSNSPSLLTPQQDNEGIIDSESSHSSQIESKEAEQTEASDGHDTRVPEQEPAPADHYITMLKDMTLRSVEDGDYVLAVQRMHEFMRLVRSNPEQSQDHVHFKKCVEHFLVFFVALREGDYRRCLEQMQQLIDMSESGCMEAHKCTEFGVHAAIQHIVELRESVIELTSTLHSIAEPDEFDRVAEELRVLRQKVESSNMLMETCMRGSDDKGKSETVLACISYGFKVGRLSR